MQVLEHPIPKEWRSLCRRVRGWIVAGWWWRILSRFWVAGAGVTALLAWVLRAGDGPLTPVVGAVAAAWTLMAVLVTGMVADPHPVSDADALSRLDVGWGLHHRLTAAFRGVGAWPAVPEPRPPLPVAPRWQSWGPPLLIGLGFVLAAVWIPLPPETAGPSIRRAEPPDWRSMQAFTEELEEAEWLQPETVRRMREEVEALRATPETDWYRPATLEATDRLRSRMAAEASRMSEGMNRTASLLQVADPQNDGLSGEQRQALQRELQRMREQMGENGMRMRPEIMDALRQLDLSQVPGLDGEQLADLERQLRENGEALREAMEAAGLLGPGGMEGMQPGGGPDGGGPEALGLGDRETFGRPQVPVGLELKDPRQAEAGDLLEEREIEHDPTVSRERRGAGAVSAPGGGGGAVWTRDLLPEEQGVLKQFFNSESEPPREAP